MSELGDRKATGPKVAATASATAGEAEQIVADFLGKVDQLFGDRRHRSLYYEFLRFVPASLLPKMRDGSEHDSTSASAGDADEAAAVEDAHSWVVSSTLEAFDTSKNRWLLAKVRELRPNRMLLHFIGCATDVEDHCYSLMW